MTRRLSALALLLVALVFVVAACGGDDEGSGSAAAPTADIVDTAVDAGSFTTLASLLETTGLVETLKGEGPFTVFAPTDDAFAALPEGTLDELGRPENADQLQGILLYHVAEGEARSSDLSDGQQVPTVQGADITIGVGDDGVTANDATVTTADVEATNGVIHVIDGVLLPPSS
jgi:uncharacterized surface protein with fasciclin (FAS1) repeats